MAAKKTASKKKAVAKPAPQATPKTAPKVAPKAAPKAAPKPAAKKTPAINEPLKQAELFGSLADDTGLSRSQVQSVIDSLSDHIERSLRPKAKAGEIRFCGLKVFRHKIPARKARKGYIPATGQYIDIPAKKAKQIIKVSTLKKVDDIVA